MSSLVDLERHGERCAVVLPDGQTLTYLALAAGADARACALRAGDLAAVECDNSLAALQAYLGCLRARVPVALVDAGLAPELKEALYEHYRFSAVFGPSGEWLRRRKLGPKLHEALALLLSTSGSTGSPKLVRLSLGNLDANASAIGRYLGLDSQSRAITALPLQYSFGLSIVHSHLLCGGSLALTNASITERSFWNFFEQSEANSLSGVPTMLEMLRRLRIERMPLPRLTTLTQAGGRLQPDTVRWYAELAAARGWRFYVMYGQTEATARMAYLPPEQAREHPDSVGIPIPNGRFELADEHGQPFDAVGRVGELVYRGPNVMLGYAEGPEDLALGDVQRGVLRTGDLAERDQHGLWYIRGRTKRFVKVFGNRIGLDEVEGFLRGHGLEVRVTGRDDLLVVAATEAAQLPEAVRLTCETYRLHKSAVSTLHLVKWPLSAAGKVLYSELISLYEALTTRA